MSTALKRTHILIPEDLTEDLDRIVGQRKRSKFITQAVREKVNQLKLMQALKKTAGVIKADDYPEWKTSEDVYRWVRGLRKESDKRLKKVMKRR